MEQYKYAFNSKLILAISYVVSPVAPIATNHVNNHLTRSESKQNRAVATASIALSSFEDSRKFKGCIYSSGDFCVQHELC